MSSWGTSRRKIYLSETLGPVAPHRLALNLSSSLQTLLQKFLNPKSLESIRLSSFSIVCTFSRILQASRTWAVVACSLRGPAAILFTSRETCSDSIAKVENSFVLAANMAVQIQVGLELAEWGIAQL